MCGPTTVVVRRQLQKSTQTSKWYSASFALFSDAWIPLREEITIERVHSGPAAAIKRRDFEYTKLIHTHGSRQRCTDILLRIFI